MRKGCAGDRGDARRRHCGEVLRLELVQLRDRQSCDLSSRQSGGLRGGERNNLIRYKSHSLRGRERSDLSAR